MNKDRPPCPECGSREVISNGGTRWLCKLCGLSFPKIKHPREKPDYANRPPCPRCGAYHSIIHSDYEYRCGKCGRVFKKDYYKKEYIETFIPSQGVIDKR